MIVTIDGPSGTGKSTVARQLAEKLGFSFFDTGAMYRALAWWILEENRPLPNEKDLAEFLQDFHFSIEEKEAVKKYEVNGQDVTEAIRTEPVTKMSSKVSAIGGIREFLLPIQREFAKTCDSVFEGRDLGTVVFPEADVKFFLTASLEVRSKRRYQEILSKTPQISIRLEEVMDSLQTRDRQDMTRAVAPLTCPKDAFKVDTSNYSASEVVEILFKHTLTKRK